VKISAAYVVPVVIPESSCAVGLTRS